jgi:hypothetical protein
MFLLTFWKTKQESVTMPVLHVEREVFEVINGGFDVCCSECHSRRYNVHPVEGDPFDRWSEKNDVWYRCGDCGHTWPSGFLEKIRRIKS